MSPRSERGFTLIEVLVAIAILGLGLTAILTAQAGTFNSVSHSKNISQATGLVRCKATEVEADLQVNGFYGNDVTDSGPCCDGQLNSKITCTWSIEVPQFPPAAYGDNGNLDTSGGVGGPSSNASSPITSSIDALKNGTSGNIGLPSDGNIGGIADSLSSDGTSITDGITSMLMNIVYPDIQQIFESGTRKVTVTATWMEGATPQSIEVVEWITSGRAAGVTSETPDEANADPDSGTGTSTSTGSGRTKK